MSARIITCIAVFIFMNFGCNNPKSKSFVFDAPRYSSINSTILAMNSPRGEIGFDKFSKREIEIVNKLEIQSIYVSKVEGRSPVISYTIHTSGIVTSGTCESVVYSEEPRAPIVVNLWKARSSGDNRIVIYQKLKQNWYLESVQN